MNTATIGFLAYGLSPLGLATDDPMLLAAGAYSPGLSWELQMERAHAGCHVSAFCRNPLHPGPCKGWKHHLGLVSPGALHALEKARYEKLEERRKSKVAALLAQGKRVPKSLQTPIVYDPAKNPHITNPDKITPGLGIPTQGLTPEAAKKTIAAVPTASDLRQKVDARRAAAAAVKPTEPPVLRTVAQAGLKPGDEVFYHGLVTNQGHPDFGKTHSDGVLAVVEKNGSGYALKDAKTGDVLTHIGAGAKRPLSPAPGRSFPDLKAPTPGPSPTAPLPAGTAAHVQHAVSIAHRSGHRAGVSKVQMDAYNNLTKAEFDALPDDTKKRITDDLTAAHAKFLDPKKQRSVEHTMARLGVGPRPAPMGAPTTTAPAPAAPASTFDGKIDSVRKLTDPHKITVAVQQLRYHAKDADSAKKLSDLRQELANRPDLPTWAKANILFGDDDVRAKIKASSGMDDAVAAAIQAPAPSGQVFTTTFGFENLLKAKEKDLDKLPRPIADAVRERRDLAAKQLIGSNNVGTPTRQEALIHLFGSQDDPKLDHFDNLGQQAQKDVIAGISRHAENNTAIGSPHNLIAGSQWQGLHDKLTGKVYSNDQADAIEAAQNTRLTALGRLNKLEMVSSKEFDELAHPHRALLLDTVEKIRDNSPDQNTQMSAAQTAADWQGQIPKYPSFAHGSAAGVATWLKKFTDPDQRAAAYNSPNLTPDSFGAFTPEHRRAVLADMQDLANDRNAPHITLQDRHDLQYKHDVVTGDALKRSPEAQVAVAFSSSTTSGIGQSDKINAYSKLTKADYDALPTAYQDSIQHDLENIGISDPMAHDKIQSVINPGGFTPLFRPTTPAPSASPELKDAVDTLYGLHPQARTATHQLKTYGALRREHFNQLNPQEQQTLLGDLSYIATTSKGANKDRAQKLIDRFTPPGTPPGTIPPQAIYPPSNAVVGQTRFPDPKGQTGLLVQATDKGVSGDGWLRLPDGRKGPWGQYGAAGALLRHVGPDGKERFLMVERGPGISDPGKWQFPGGAIDSKESAHQGAAREIIEELGFKSNALKDAAVHGHHESAFPGTNWKYTSIAATVPTQLVPDLSTHHARAETSDAKWMTREEIAKLDQDGKLLKPLAGGALERNVLSLFPSTATSVSRPAPRTTKPARLTGAPSLSGGTPSAVHHKPSIAKNLVATPADQDALRNAIKGPVRQSYRGKTADERLAAIGAMQGFDRTPTVKSKQEIDALLASGEYVEAWRGVRGSYAKSAHDINEDFRTGPAYYGTGVFGNGYYFATDKKLAEAYSDRTSGSVQRILIPKSFKSETHDKVISQAKNASSSAGSFRHVGRAGMGGGTLHDEGRYAAAKGLDAIEIPASTYRSGGGNSQYVRGSVYNLLNRSIVIAQEA